MYRDARCYVTRTFPVLFTFSTIALSLRWVIKTIANALIKSHSAQVQHVVVIKITKGVTITKERSTAQLFHKMVDRQRG